jgi:hypothetical protein
MWMNHLQHLPVFRSFLIQQVNVIVILIIHLLGQAAEGWLAKPKPAP